MKTYPQTDTTKWAVVREAPFTVSGTNEIIGRFQTKREAEDWRKASGHNGSYKTERVKS